MEVVYRPATDISSNSEYNHFSQLFIRLEQCIKTSTTKKHQRTHASGETRLISAYSAMALVKGNERFSTEPG